MRLYQLVAIAMFYIGLKKFISPQLTAEHDVFLLLLMGISPF